MIDNLEGSNFIQINTPDDLTLRSDYMSEIDPEVSQVAEVIGSYTLAKQIQCGVAGCAKPHLRGSLIRTVDGKETNIGQACGKKHYGSELAVKSAEFEKKRAYSNQLAIIQDVIARKEQLLERIQTINNQRQGAKWLLNSKRELRKVLPDDAWGKLLSRATRGDIEVNRVVELNAKQIDDLVTANPGSTREQFRVKSDLMGSFVGIEVLNSDIREVLMTKIHAQLQQIDRVNVKKLTPFERRKWVNWANQIEALFVEATEIINTGVSFFTPHNFGLMQYLTLQRAEQARLAALTWDASQIQAVKSKR